MKYSSIPFSHLTNFLIVTSGVMALGASGAACADCMAGTARMNNASKMDLKVAFTGSPMSRMMAW